MKLVFVAHRRRATLEVTHVSAFVGHDQRALELAGVGRVDAEVRGKLHRTTHALRDVTERTVGEDRRIQRREKVVRVRHDHAEIFPHQVGMFAHGFAERAENDALRGERFPERGRDRNAVEHGVHRDTGEAFALPQRNTEFLVGFEQLRVHFLEAPGPVTLLLRRRVVNDALVVNRLVPDLRPRRLFQRQPVPKRLEPPRGQPFRFSFFARDEPDDVFVQTRRRGIDFDIRVEAVFIFLFDQALNGFSCRAHKLVVKALKR